MERSDSMSRLLGMAAAMAVLGATWILVHPRAQVLVRAQIIDIG